MIIGLIGRENKQMRAIQRILRRKGFVQIENFQSDEDYEKLIDTGERGDCFYTARHGREISPRLRCITKICIIPKQTAIVIADDKYAFKTDLNKFKKFDPAYEDLSDFVPEPSYIG